MRISVKITSFFTVFILCIGCNSRQQDQKNISADSTTSIKLESSVIDFGEIRSEDSLYGTFSVTNTGNIPLVIDSVIASCGCTAPKWAKSSIATGKTTQIFIGYKPNLKHLGQFSKSVVFQANTHERFHVLYLKGNVINTAN